jgi:hypothetical protein
MALLKASLATLKGISFSREDLGKDMGSLKDLLESPTAIGMVVERIVSFATSGDVDAALFRCFQRATYTPPGGAAMKVTLGLFDHTEHGNAAREDYAQIVAHVLEVNCRPFVAAALSGFLARPKAMVESAAPSTRLS